MPLLHVVVCHEDLHLTLLLAFHQSIILFTNHLSGFLNWFNYGSSKCTASRQRLIIGTLLIDDIILMRLEDVTEVLLGLLGWGVERAIQHRVSNLNYELNQSFQFLN